MAASSDAVIVLEFIKDLDRRVKVLEDRYRATLWTDTARLTDKEDELVKLHGEFVDKTVASKILGVTRATVYAMLADGRIDGAYEGKRVDVRSIARYITRKGETHAG